ncbi:GATA-type zinc finger protein 1-like isoform X2 [Centruroides sculpturatus]|uniref:GATA-type zinc finger protein 1-like isoform X2 n=1 Tax=Centruroides sculpturatus TaxID=218467 RepID=UPI000C6E875D|nr:GATA-type zinc finger protein 1-like isoform X2 [Centruroides sculpturatus]
MSYYEENSDSSDSQSSRIIFETNLEKSIKAETELVYSSIANDFKDDSIYSTPFHYVPSLELDKVQESKSKISLEDITIPEEFLSSYLQSPKIDYHIDRSNHNNVLKSPLKQFKSRHRSRKQINPCKSPSPEDPNFHGFTVFMKLKINSGVPELIMTSIYRNGKNNHQKRFRRLNRWSGCSDSEDDSMNKSKQCASCNTRKTPLWRDAEDGTPLCNACGIRYKKHHVRCINCWYVPRKGDKLASICSSCRSLCWQNVNKKQ